MWIVGNSKLGDRQNRSKSCLPNQQPFTNSRSCSKAVNHRFGDGFKLRAILRSMSSIRLSKLRWAGMMYISISLMYMELFTAIQHFKLEWIGGDFDPEEFDLAEIKGLLERQEQIYREKERARELRNRAITEYIVMGFF